MRFSINSHSKGGRKSCILLPSSSLIGKEGPEVAVCILFLLAMLQLESRQFYLMSGLWPAQKEQVNVLVLETKAFPPLNKHMSAVGPKPISSPVLLS